MKHILVGGAITILYIISNNWLSVGPPDQRFPFCHGATPVIQVMVYEFRIETMVTWGSNTEEPPIQHHEKLWLYHQFPMLRSSQKKTLVAAHRTAVVAALNCGPKDVVLGNANHSCFFAGDNFEPYLNKFLFFQCLGRCFFWELMSLSVWWKSLQPIAEAIFICH